MQNLYEILELSPQAGPLEIRKAYKRLALIYHPDKAPPDRYEECQLKFNQINEAYQILSDCEQRRLYNQELASHMKRKIRRVYVIPSHLFRKEMQRQLLLNYVNKRPQILFLQRLFMP